MTKAGDEVRTWAGRINQVIGEWKENSNRRRVPPKFPFTRKDTTTLVTGSKDLTEDELDEFFTATARFLGGGVKFVVVALGRKNGSEALEQAAGRAWSQMLAEPAASTEVLYAVSPELMWVMLASIRGRGREATTLVARLEKFSSGPGLREKLPEILAEYQLDDELFDLLIKAQNFGREEWLHLNTVAFAGLMGLAAAAGRDDVLAAGFAKADRGRHWSASEVGRQVLAEYGTTQAARTIAESPSPNLPA